MLAYIKFSLRIYSSLSPMKLARPTPSRMSPATNNRISMTENGDTSTNTLISEEMKKTRAPKTKKMMPGIANKLSRIFFKPS